jgi:membrane protein implicated in regulation of membrane protease activity
MSRALIACIILALLALTVPWWWIGKEVSDSKGLPGWALYSLVMNVVFAVVVAWLIQRYWRQFEDDDEDHSSKP